MKSLNSFKNMHCWRRNIQIPVSLSVRNIVLKYFFRNLLTKWMSSAHLWPLKLNLSWIIISFSFSSFVELNCSWTTIFLECIAGPKCKNVSKEIKKPVIKICDLLAEVSWGIPSSQNTKSPTVGSVSCLVHVQLMFVPWPPDRCASCTSEGFQASELTCTRTLLHRLAFTRDFATQRAA